MWVALFHAAARCRGAQAALFGAVVPARRHSGIRFSRYIGFES
jgi:hypothetical protein